MPAASCRLRISAKEKSDALQLELASNVLPNAILFDYKKTLILPYISFAMSLTAITLALHFFHQISQKDMFAASIKILAV